MKKIISVILAVSMVFAMLALTGCGEKAQNDTDSKGDAGAVQTLVVATNAEFEPFESIDSDGNFVGFDIDLMNAIGEKMGVSIKYDNMEFDGVVAAVTQGSCDVAISGLTINEKRQKSVDFCDPYYSGAAQVLIVAANDTHFTGTTKEELDEQLKNQTIGVCSGFTGQAYAEGDDEWGFEKIEGADVKIYENISLAVKDLENGSISAIIMDDTPATKAADGNDAVKVIDVELTVEQYGIAVQKGNTDLATKINDALKALKDDGTVDKLLAKYEL